MSKFLDMVIGRKPVSKMLDRYEIPRPSTLLAGLLAVRLATLNKVSKIGDNYIYADIQVQDRIIEISGRIVRDGTAVTARGREPCIGTLKVGMPGSPTYQSVDFDKNETKIVGDALIALWHRMMIAGRIQADSDNQNAALNMIEKLL